MPIDKNLLSPCGLYCGVCAIRIAHRDNNEKFKKALVKVYRPLISKPEQIQCTGCRSDGVKFKHCRNCSIRNCAEKKGYEGCYECIDYPCYRIKLFPIKKARKVIKKTIPEWKELGTEEWVKGQKERYTCPDCGNSLFRGAKRCNKCGISVSID
jgi:hypothetical protein